MNTILIVDDEKEIADVVELYLQNEYHVLKFYAGQDALDCIESTRIDLAILDVMLPEIHISGHYADGKNGISGQDYRTYNGSR